MRVADFVIVGLFGAALALLIWHERYVKPEAVKNIEDRPAAMGCSFYAYTLAFGAAVVALQCFVLYRHKL
jgi:hypothetical protein